MKVSLRKYADALSESLKGEKDDENICKKIETLLKILAKRKQSKLVKRLSEVFKEIWLRKNGKMEVKVTLPYELSSDEESSLANLLKEAFKKEILLNVKVNKGVIGGMKLEFRDYVVDGTLLTGLAALESRMLNA